MKVFHQSSFDRWPFEDNSIQAIITSPPFYSLRKYDIPDIVIGGNPECEHKFGDVKNYILNLQAGNTEFKKQWRENATQEINNGSFCIHCNAWKGQYGLEPTYGRMIEQETDKMEIRDDISDEDRKYVISELIKRGIIA